jgi:tripartite-type tricarboxylate transporter receptor subunit TctC
LLTGTVMATTSTPAVAVASNLPVLAALSDERITTLPAVPTMRELGFPAEGFTAGGLIAPTATRDEVIAVLEGACGEAASASEYKAIVERLQAALPARRRLSQIVRGGIDPQRECDPARRPRRKSVMRSAI